MRTALSRFVRMTVSGSPRALPQVAAWTAPKSTGLFLAALVVLMTALAAPARSHEVRPAIADVSVGSTTVRIDVRLSLEPILAGIDLGTVDDTDEAPESDENDRLRELPPDQLERVLRDAWPSLVGGIRLSAGGTALVPAIDAVTIPGTGDTDLPRDSHVALRAELPADGSPVTLGWDASYGPLIVRQAGDGEDAYAGYLTGGTESAEMPRSGTASEPPATVFLRYVVLGFEHIIPKGLDHILFVLGLFFLSPRLRPLLIQVTVFTLAHTVTLALASLDIVSVPAAIVEPLIAASIVYVAVENILQTGINRWRVVVVFAFGLLHGLGFASVLGDIGLEPGTLILGLVGFNIGVEIGQIAVIVAAFLAVGLWFRDRTWYRARVATTASVLIALVGAYWLVERIAI